MFDNLDHETWIALQEHINRVYGYEDLEFLEDLEVDPEYDPAEFDSVYGRWVNY
jgi:hypothetical protein